jgi:arylsulfatase A-like enzyme
MDALRDESVRLGDFHVDSYCSPTRAALMTGRYAHRVGVWRTVISRNLLRDGEMTMAEVFRHNGYRTGHFGKWHLGGNYPYRPRDRGPTAPWFWARPSTRPTPRPLQGLGKGVR